MSYFLLNATKAKAELRIGIKKMKVKWLGKTDFLVLTNNKIYDVISIESGWYRIIDDSGDDYLYPPDMFEIVEEDK